MSGLEKEKMWLKYSQPHCKKKNVFEGKTASPAMLILAGVAFRDAGVLVRLLLLGVMPLRVERSYYIALYIK